MFNAPTPDDSLSKLLALKKTAAAQRRLSVSQFSKISAAQTEYEKRTQTGSKLMPASIDQDARKSKGYWFDRR